MRCSTRDEVLGMVLLDAFGESHAEIGEKFGRNRKAVARLLSMHEPPRKYVKLADVQKAHDLAEVREYLRSNPAAKVWEVAMCCHMGNWQAQQLVKLAKEDNVSR